MQWVLLLHMKVQNKEEKKIFWMKYVHQCPLPEIKNEPSETNKSKYQIKLFIVFKQKQYKSRLPSSTSIVL